MCLMVSNILGNIDTWISSIDDRSHSDFVMTVTVSGQIGVISDLTVTGSNFDCTNNYIVRQIVYFNTSRRKFVQWLARISTSR
jgi:hypothetical protein